MTSRLATERPVGLGRLVGLDVARCLALLGMMATHVLVDRDPGGDLTLSHQLAGGRASALFAVLAGVSLALMSGRRQPLTGRARRSKSVELAVRALLIAAAGLVLGGLGSGLAIILTYYGVLFLVGLPFLGLRARSLAILAGAWLVAAPVVSHVLRPAMPERGFRSPVFEDLAEPGRLLSELLLTGYYPVLPWLAYLLAGMALGRLDLSSRRVQVRIAAVGAGLAVVASVVSSAATHSAAVVAALLDAPGVSATSGPALLEQISGGMYGTTPTGGAWQWLLVDAPHSGTPFDLARTIGSSLLVIGVALLVVGVLPAIGRTAVRLLFGAGTMTLTLYSLHVVMRTDLLWPPERPDTYVWHVLVVLGIGLAFVAAGARGPLEAFVSAASKGWAAKLVH